MAKEEDAQLLEWMKELDSIQSMRQSIKNEVDSITKELQSIKEQKGALNARIEAEETAAKVAAAATAAVAAVATAVAAVIPATAVPSDVAKNSPSHTPASDSPSSSYIGAPLVKTNSTDVLRPQPSDAQGSDSPSEQEGGRKKGSVIIHGSDDDSSNPSSPSGSLIIKSDVDDLSLNAAVQSMEKVVKSPSNKEKERAERDRKKAEDREKRKSGSGHVWFGFKQDSNKEVGQHEGDKGQAAAATAATHVRSPSGAALKKKSSHSRSFSLGLPNVFMKQPTSPLATKESSKHDVSDDDKKEKTSIAKWFGGDKSSDAKSEEKKSKKKGKKGSKVEVKEDESEEAPFAGVPFHKLSSPPPRKVSLVTPVASAVTVPASPQPQPIAMVSVSEPLLGTASDIIDEPQRPASPSPLASPQHQLRMCIKLESESDDDFSNLYLDKDKSTIAALKEKIAAKYGKQATQIDWVKMKNTRGRFVMIAEEDVSNLETDQELIVRFV